MNVTIIMPSMRSENWHRVRHSIVETKALAPDVQVSWMPVVYRSELEKATPEELSALDGSWITTLIISEEPEVYHAVRKENAAIDFLQGSGFDGWLVVWSDDNLFPRAWANRLVDCDLARPGVIVFSCRRGQRAVAPPPRDFGTGDLIAAPENIRIGGITGEQYVFHSSLVGRLRFAHRQIADGEMVEEFFRRFPDTFRFTPDFFIPFNALEENRWDEAELKRVVEDQV